MRHVSALFVLLVLMSVASPAFALSGPASPSDEALPSAPLPPADANAPTPTTDDEAPAAAPLPPEPAADAKAPTPSTPTPIDGNNKGSPLLPPDDTEDGPAPDQSLSDMPSAGPADNDGRPDYSSSTSESE